MPAIHPIWHAFEELIDFCQIHDHCLNCNLSMPWDVDRYETDYDMDDVCSSECGEEITKKCEILNKKDVKYSTDMEYRSLFHKLKL